MTLKYENKKLRQGYSQVIGCDEVGRGCLAGPVVAAAVVLPYDAAGDKLKVHKVYKVIKDSKLLTPRKREELSAIIKSIAVAWSIGEVSPDVVDEINVHNASLLAMKKAVDGLAFASIPEFFAADGNHKRKKYPGSRTQQTSVNRISGSRLSAALVRDGTRGMFLFVDGKFKIPNLDISQEAIVDGDNKVLSIAAASIIAKVYRDNLMRNLHQQYPIYNLAQHKGYATEHHRAMVLKHGLSSIHRKTFCASLV